MPHLTPEDLAAVTFMAYSKWAQEFDLLKAVKTETNDGSKDWALFHAARREHHSIAECKAKELLQRLQQAAKT